MPLPTARLRRTPSVLAWDGHSLDGPAEGRRVAVAVPARLISFRSESFPPGPLPTLRAAARLRAERAFAALGPVAAEALIAPPQDGTCRVLLMALPHGALAQIRAAVEAAGGVLAAVRPAELCGEIPAGGLVQRAGQAVLVAAAQGRARAVAVLGDPADPGFAARLERERLRLDLPADAPAAAGGGELADFLHPTLAAPEPLLARPGVRLGLLAGAAAIILAASAWLMAGGALAARDEADARLRRLSPQSTLLAQRRGELRELAAWFTQRPALAPGLGALAGAMPPPGEGSLRLNRVRQVPGDEAVCEGVAGDRAQLMAFLGRLRQDPLVAGAELRSFRSLGKGSEEVAFEIVFRLAGGAHAAS